MNQSKRAICHMAFFPILNEKMHFVLLSKSDMDRRWKYWVEKGSSLAKPHPQARIPAVLNENRHFCVHAPKVVFWPAPHPLSCTHMNPEPQTPEADQQARRPAEGWQNDVAEERRRGGTSECQNEFSWGQSERSPATGQPESRGGSPFHFIPFLCLPIHLAESHLHHSIKPAIHPWSPCVT
ncbi:uncharacterized protein LOC130540749 [Pan paniscus]|uniref:uncharacterized protein LOC130540749 n=1 Tax=Pan paniscus TaxID=9597 RepID=UPI0015608F06|nr:uncharacterized protein LOC130540749 [Pan paniscus]